MQIIVREQESFPHAIKRFRIRVEKSGILSEIRDRQFFLSRVEKRKLKSHRAEKRRRRSMRNRRRKEFV